VKVVVVVITTLLVRERAVVATTGSVTPLLLKALLKTSRIEPRVKLGVQLFVKRRVVYIRITLRSVDFSFVGFRSLAVVLGFAKACS